MTTTVDAPRAGAPWHFWLATLIGLLWNAYGAYDYWMTKTGGDAYLRTSGMNDAQVAQYHSMPAYMTAVWAVGVWGGLLGAILMLARSRWAFHVFLASLAAFLVSLVYAFGLSDEAKVMGQQMVIVDAVILAGCVFFVWYSRLMGKRGVLR
ncbi:MAG: hypothetical protein JF588_22565 [Caulobacterales bacterium]|nr:hypothetical protein [Caulobacterales bacterium]